jgi:hypothetical protein
MSKKKTHYALDQRYARPNVREFIDFDYINKLSESEKAWLNEFSKGYYSADLKNSKIFTDSETKRQLFGANNARLRDTYNKATRHLWKPGNEIELGLVDESLEDRIIATLDGDLPNEDETE